MDSRTGKKIRMGRLFNQESGRALIVAYSHGVLMGPRPGMRSLQEMQSMTAALQNADGLMITPGMLPALEGAFIGRGHPSLVLHLDYQNFSRAILPYAQGASAPLAEIEEVVAAGADAVMTYLYLGYDDPQHEKMEIERNARTARLCEKWGLLLMIEPRSAREANHPEDKSDPQILGLYCRVAAEIGADLVKCIYPGSSAAMAQVIEGCPAPVLVAGGSKAAAPEAAYQRAKSAMAAGAAGLVFGRNIYEAADPAGELERYRRIVHGPSNGPAQGP
jgi:fructose-bisphosphate aldolase, class I